MSNAQFMPATFNGTKKAGDALDKMRLADGSPKFVVQIVPHTANALRGWDADGNPAAWTLDDIVSYTTGPLPAVAKSGSYADLLNRPALGTAAAANAAAFATAAQGAKADSALQSVPAQTWASITGKPTFSSVATSGAYADLSGLPMLGSASAQNVAYFATAAQGTKADAALPSTSFTWANLTGKPTLATVATTGIYADLTGRPTLAAVATSGQYADLIGKPTITTYSAATTTALGIVKEAEALTASASVALANNSGGTSATAILPLPAITAPTLLTAAASQATVSAALASQANNNATMAANYNLLLARFEQLVAKLQAAGLLAT